MDISMSAVVGIAFILLLVILLITIAIAGYNAGYKNGLLDACSFGLNMSLDLDKLGSFDSEEEVSEMFDEIEQEIEEEEI